MPGKSIRPGRCVSLRPEKSYSSGNRHRFALLSPSGSAVSNHRFLNLSTDPCEYRRLLLEGQKLRGSSYLADGAIRSTGLVSDRTFRMGGDESAWHLLLIGTDEAVVGCVRYIVHDRAPRFEDLRVRNCPVIKGMLGRSVRAAIERDLQLAKSQHLSYVEIGGWAIDERWRMTRAALDMVAASYALGDLWGGSLGICTATLRHGSSGILRKFGAMPFTINGQPMKPYEDSAYKCEMELLRFESVPAERFIPLVEPLRRQLLKVPVVRRGCESQTRRDWTEIHRDVA